MTTEAKIRDSLKKFSLSLKSKLVLTEGATGNYCVTPVIAALAGANVYAYAKDSSYGLAKEARRRVYGLAGKMGVRNRITITEDINDIDLKKIDILTNTGFLRPIDKKFISKLTSRCVIPLMWEPWEYRKEDLDLEACQSRGIKVYGTKENDKRVRTMDYMGLSVLKLLLDQGVSPFSAKVLLVGCNRFTWHVEGILKKNNFPVSVINDYARPAKVKDFDVIIILEHLKDILLIGGKKAFINKKDLDKNTLVVHICGNVSFKEANFRFIPKNPSKFGYMSYTVDFIDNKAVIDLHTAGLKVAEGMLEANKLGLSGMKYKIFMEKKYPALAFNNPRLW